MALNFSYISTFFQSHRVAAESAVHPATVAVPVIQVHRGRADRKKLKGVSGPF